MQELRIYFDLLFSTISLSKEYQDFAIEVFFRIILQQSDNHALCTVESLIPSAKKQSLRPHFAYQWTNLTPKFKAVA